MALKKTTKRVLQVCAWIAAIPCLLTIVMVPEQPLFLIPVVGSLTWMAGSTICTWIDESREERR